MMQRLPNGDFETYKDFFQGFVDDILYTLEVSVIGFVLQTDLIYPDETKQKTRRSPFVWKLQLLHKISSQIICSKINQNAFHIVEKTICDWTNNKNYIANYTLL